MKVTKKRGKRGANRKRLEARVSPDAYSWLCQWAGNNSLARALDALLLEHREKSSELVTATSRGEKNCAIFKSSSE